MPIDPALMAEVEQEFRQNLDTYMAEWEESLSSETAEMSARDSIEDRLIACAQSFKDVDGLGPDYQRLFWNADTHTAWWEGFDGDEDDGLREVRRRLKAVDGVDEVTIESEASPPRDKPGWVLLYPKRKAWSQVEMSADSQRDTEDDAEVAELVAEILYGLFGEDALKHVGSEHAEFSEFHEEDHPRAEDGKFGSGGSHGEKPAKSQGVESQAGNGDRGSDGSVAAAEADYKANGTKAKAFLQWFGDWENDPEKASKVVNAEGEPQETAQIGSVKDRKGKPIPVFHGTTKDFESFDKSARNPDAFWGPGFYFAEDEKLASGYTPGGVGGKAKRVVKAYLNIRNPLDMDAEMDDAQLRKIGDMMRQHPYGPINKAVSQLRSGMTGEQAFDVIVSAAGSVAPAAQIVQKLGHDGITHLDVSMDEPINTPPSHRVWVAFEPHQIKAVANRGTFDPDNPNLSMSAWNPLHHPRGPNGRFIPRGSAEARGAAKEAIGRVLKGEHGGGADDVLQHLNILTVKQLRELHKEHGQAIPGKLRQQLVDAVRGRMGESKPEVEVPAAEKVEQPEQPAIPEIATIPQPAEQPPAVQPEEEPHAESTGEQPTDSGTGTEPAAGESGVVPTAGTEPGGRPELGGAGSGDVARTRTEGRIVTARAEFTRPGNPELVPESLRGFLKPHQLDGTAKAIESMDAHGGFLLADGTGVGKTREQLAVAKTYADRGNKVLIVSPKQVINPDKKGNPTGSFANDSAAMGIALTMNKGDAALAAGQVQLCTYEALAKIKDKIDDNTVVIYDEAHYGKNFTSARSKHMQDIADKASSVMYATATPADQPLHIGYLFRAKVFGSGSRNETFRELGLEQVEQRVPGGNTVKIWKTQHGVTDSEVRRRIDGLFDRMTQDGLMVKREISFEGVNVHVDQIKFEPEVHEKMDKIEERLSKTEMPAGLMRAQILFQQRLQQEPHKIPHAINAAKEELAQGRSVIIFMARVNKSEVGGEGEEGEEISSEGTAKLLKEALAREGIHDVAEIHGGNKKGIPKAVEDFQSGKARVVIATVESGGTGINLDDTVGDRPRTMIGMTPPFSANSLVQALGRGWRLNTKSDFRARLIYGDTQVDHWNANLAAKKLKLLNAAVGGELKNLQFTPEDVAEVGGKQAEPYHWNPLVGPAATASATMPFGKHQGKRLADVPRDYLQWLSGQELREPLRSTIRQHLQATKPPPPSPTPPKPAPASAPAAPRETEPPRPAPEITTKHVTEEQRAAVHSALRQLAGDDPDKARQRNAIGFNQADSQLGAQLAEADKLTDAQVHRGAEMLAKYHRQIPAETLAAAKKFEEKKTPLVTRKVNTARGERHVYSFPPSQAFWAKWKGWKDKGGKPEYVSVGKNPRTGDWEATVWGSTPEETAKNVESLRGQGVSLSHAAELSTGPHSYASTQFDLPEALALQVKDFAAEIPDDELGDEGRENSPHITCKYGLHSSDPERLRDLLAPVGPITVTLGATSVFTTDEADVLKVDVYGVGLIALNKLISESLANTETHGVFKAHLTICYLRPGKGKKYAGDERFDGTRITFDTLTFSPSEGPKVEIPLSGALSMSEFHEEQHARDEDGEFVLREPSDAHRHSHAWHVRKDFENYPHMLPSTDRPADARFQAADRIAIESKVAHVLRKAHGAASAYFLGKTGETGFRVGEGGDAYVSIKADAGSGKLYLVEGAMTSSGGRRRRIEVSPESSTKEIRSSIQKLTGKRLPRASIGMSQWDDNVTFYAALRRELRNLMADDAEMSNWTLERSRTGSAKWRNTTTGEVRYQRARPLERGDGDVASQTAVKPQSNPVMPEGKTALSQHEKSIASQPREKGFILSPDGKVLAELNQSGDATELILSDADEKAAANAVFTHNHPDATAPSVGDFYQASRLNMQQMRIVTSGEDGEHVYTLDRPADGWPTWDQITKAEEGINMEVLAETDRRHERGKFDTKKKARQFMRHETASRLAIALGINYQKLPLAEAAQQSREQRIQQLSDLVEGARRGNDRTPTPDKFATYTPPQGADAIGRVDQAVGQLSGDKYRPPTLQAVYNAAKASVPDLTIEQLHGILGRLRRENKIDLLPYTRAIGEIEHPEYVLPLSGELNFWVRSAKATEMSQPLASDGEWPDSV